MSEWYLKDPAGATSGPFATQAIVQWISTGQVRAEHAVCAVNTSQWVPVTEVPAFLGALVAARGAGPQAAGPPQAQGYPPPQQPRQPSAPQLQPQGPVSGAYPQDRPSGVAPMSGRIGGTMAIPALMEAEVAPSAPVPPGPPGPPGPKARTMLGQMAFSGPESMASGRVAVIGRTPGVDIVLPYPQISGRHAGVSPTPDGMLAITDYGSTNGTHVEGKRIAPNVPVKIKPGSKVFIGPYAMFLGLEGNTVRAWVDSDRTDWSGNLVEIEALDLFLQVDDREHKATKKTLLNHVTFKAHPGDLIALMGPSGAGKTTLLTVLNGYLRPTSGQVRVNGEDLYAIYDALRGSIGYVPQDDIVHAELTVFEAIKYSAQFRLPPDFSEDEINRRVEQVIKDLSLEQVKNLEIGKPERKVLSGGQRKRVNIALELVTDPALMFLDEPTSGLAADDTVALIDLLSSLAKKYGKTIIVTIHQPAREEYEKFNLALIMGFGGNPVYFGPTGKESYEFFGRYAAAAKGLVIDNPRDMFDQLKKREEDAAASGQFPTKAAARSAAAAQWRAEFYDANNPTYRKMYSGARQPGTPSANRAPSRAKVPLLRQFWLLLKRYATVKRRDTAGTAILLAQAPIIGVLLAVVFSDPAKTPNLWCQQFLQNVESAARAKGAPIGECTADLTRFTKVADFSGAIFFLAVAALWFGTSNAAREIVSEQSIYRRERMVNLSIFNYVMSKFTFLSLLCLVQCTVLLTIVFAALGLGDYSSGAYVTMLAFMVMTAMCAASIGLLLSTVVTSSEAAMALTPIALIPQVVLGGRMVPMTNKGWLEYVMAVIPSRWSFEGVLAADRTELAGAWKVKACVNSGPGIVNGKFNCALEEMRNVTQGGGALGFSTYNEPMVAFGVLLAMTVVSMTMVMILLKRRDSVWAVARVLVSAPLPGPAVDLLRAAHEVEVGADPIGLGREGILARVGDRDALITLVTDRVDAELLAAAPRLRVVANCGVGVDNLDLDACRRRGVAVTNTPDVLTEATADATFALLLDACRRVTEGDRAVRAGRWRGWAPTEWLGVRVTGATLGIVGLGRIGRAVAERARGFRMRVVYTQRHRADEAVERALGASYATLDELLGASEIVALCCPLDESSRGLLSRERIARLRPGAVVVSTSRGACLDELALAEALREGRVAAAGLDVFAREPEVPEALLACETAVLTPHLGSADRPTREAMARICADAVLAVLDGREPRCRVA